MDVPCLRGPTKWDRFPFWIPFKAKGKRAPSKDDTPKCTFLLGRTQWNGLIPLAPGGCINPHKSRTPWLQMGRCAHVAGVLHTCVRITYGLYNTYGSARFFHLHVLLQSWLSLQPGGKPSFANTTLQIQHGTRQEGGPQKECPPKEWMGVSSVHLHTKSCAGSLAFFRSFLVRHLGGTLQLISLPGYGALAFLFIGGWEGSGVVTQCFNRARRKVELA